MKKVISILTSLNWLKTDAGAHQLQNPIVITYNHGPCVLSRCPCYSNTPSQSRPTRANFHHPCSHSALNDHHNVTLSRPPSVTTRLKLCNRYVSQSAPRLWIEISSEFWIFSVPPSKPRLPHRYLSQVPYHSTGLPLQIEVSSAPEFLPYSIHQLLSKVSRLRRIPSPNQLPWSVWQPGPDLHYT